MPRPRATDPLNGRRILVVEDDYFLAEDLRQELTSRGAVVMGPVADVTAAFDLLVTEEPPQAAVLDVRLGEELVYPLAEFLERRGTRFVFVTVVDQRDLPPAHAKTPHIDKPVQVAWLMQLLANL